MISQDIRDWVRTKLWYQLPESISVIDPNFNIVEANPSFAKNYGDWQGKPCYEVYKGREERCMNCAAMKTFADGLTRVREEQGMVRDGKQTYYLVHMVPLIGHEGDIPYVVEISTDITSMHLLKQEKLEAERLAAVGQTVAGLAHSIKNLLMGIEGGMYILHSGLQKGDSERIAKGWKILEGDINRITSFVKEFLEFARGKEPKVMMIDPNLPAEQAFMSFQDSASLKGIRLCKNLETNIEPAMMDTDGIHTCLGNLISNAIDACSMSDKPNRNIVLSTSEHDSKICYEVADDDCGMDYEVKKKVFTSYFSTKSSGKGTGLGLLTTRKIVHEHGGRVSFESTSGAGSIFRIEFPRDRLPKKQNETEEK